MLPIMEDRMCMKLIAIAEEFYRDPKNIEGFKQYMAAKGKGQAGEGGENETVSEHGSRPAAHHAGRGGAAARGGRISGDRRGRVSPGVYAESRESIRGGGYAD